MDEYNNIPVGWNGPDVVLYTEQLPEKYSVFSGDGINKDHVCYHPKVSKEGSWIEGKSLCGYSDSYFSSVEGVSIYPCESCLSVLSSRLEGYLYDEEENEYYNPRL